MAKMGPRGAPERVVHHAILPYVPTFGACMTAKHNAVTTLRDAADGLWKMHITVFRSDGRRIATFLPFNPAGPAVVHGDELEKFGVLRLGATVWTLSDSIHIENMYHGYLVLVNVPDPAPWETKNEIAALEDTARRVGVTANERATILLDGLQCLRREERVTVDEARAAIAKWSAPGFRLE